MRFILAAAAASGLLIAFPIANYFMNEWLRDYAYKADVSWWIFAVASAGSLLITVIVVSFHAIKAAVANPVRSLRTE